MWIHKHHEEIEKLICSKCPADINKDYSPCKNCKRGDDFELGYEAGLHADVHTDNSKVITELKNKIADIKANCDLAIEGRDVKVMELEKDYKALQTSYNILKDNDEKIIKEMGEQIEKMKCCENCHHHFFNLEDIMECAEGLDVTSKHCDKWELRI